MSDALACINKMGKREFTALFGPIYEHSPWAAERAFTKSPFIAEAQLLAALRATVDAATDEERLALVRAHPELAGEKLRQRALTAASMREQASIGLDELGDRDIAEWAELNRRYRERFGFPFVICVRLHNRDEILAEMRRRSTAAREAELAEAIGQIHEIARLRLEDLLASLPA